MRILVTNVGSTSLKYRLYHHPEEKLLASGRVERIGSNQGAASWIHGDKEGSNEKAYPSHKDAIEFVLQQLREDMGEASGDVDCVAFKTVIAKGYVGCEILDETVLQAMEDYTFLAPAHNPPYIKAVRLFKEIMPDTPLIGLFEPAFHLTMPDYARVYPIPQEWRDKYQIQRYGFHGASHRYVSERIPQLVGKPREELKIISCHLGGSSSLCAIDQGKSIDTSLGFTPQSGVFHATRIGELDPYAVLFVMREEGCSIEEINPKLTKESGLLGLSGVSDDMRDIEIAIDQGNEKAKLAFNAFIYAVKKFIGSYYAILGGLDVLAFAGGIGEKGARVREAVCSNLEHLGITIDSNTNQTQNGKEAEISPPKSQVSTWIVPTNEELIVARAAYEKLTS